MVSVNDKKKQWRKKYDIDDDDEKNNKSHENIVKTSCGPHQWFAFKIHELLTPGSHTLFQHIWMRSIQKFGECEETDFRTSVSTLIMNH